ncbi:MAG: class I SAM-dependent methyltransferase [Hyphomicrobiaceae bacterium]
MTDPIAEAFAVNRAAWDERARVHVKDASGFYGVAEFKNGGVPLSPIEAEEIGDVAGKRLVHLQCHFGLDTLQLARMGARVTGLDFSGEAIAAARALAAEIGIAATFVEGTVYDARRLIDGHFDIAYVTWGALNWLPDVCAWVQVVASLLAKGGVLYLAETHPCVLALSERDGCLVATNNWRTPKDRPLAYEDDGSLDDALSYTGDRLGPDGRRGREWIHPLSDILGGSIAAGLQITMFREHEMLPYKGYEMMVPVGHGLYRLPDGAPRFPLAFSLKATKL